MQVTITARHFTLSPHSAEEFKEKIAQIGRFDDHAQYIDVVCNREHEMAMMEWKIGIKGAQPVVLHTEAQDLRTCIDILMEKAEKTLVRHKEMRTQKERSKITEVLEA